MLPREAGLVVGNGSGGFVRQIVRQTEDGKMVQECVVGLSDIRSAVERLKNLFVEFVYESEESVNYEDDF